MGKNASKTEDKTSNTNYSSNTNAATTGQTRVNVPDWLLNPAQKQASTIGGIMDQGPGAFTPQMSDLTKTALGNAANLDTTGAGFSGAENAYNSVRDVTGQSLLDNLDSYKSPYTQSVVNSTLNDYDVDAAKQRAAMAARGASGAFGGSRFGVAEGELGGDLARGRASTESGLLDTAFTRATGLSADDAARRQAAMTSNQGADLSKASGLASLAGQKDAAARANLQLQSTLGGQKTDFENVQRQYPLAFAEQTGGLLGQMNPQTYFGQDAAGTSTSNTVGKEDTVSKTKTTEDPGLLGTLGGVMNLAKSGVGLFGAFTGNPLLAAAGGIGK